MNTADVITNILEDHKELLSIPHSLAEILRISRDENFTASELAKVIMRDPALTAKMLRIVNSPYYGASRQVTTISQAVVMMGIRQITALAMSSSIYNFANSWQSSIDRIRFWRHSLEVALASRLLAEAIEYPYVEEAFVAGLLHDIGILILEKSFPDEYGKVYERGSKYGNILEYEEEAWGTNHARVGQFLLEQWNIPQAICEAVGHHHDQYSNNSNNPEMLYSQLVNLANILSRFSLLAEKATDREIDIENREVLRENLNLSEEKLNSVQEKLFHKTIEEATYLEFDIGTPEELLKEANKLLLEQYLTLESLLRENRKMQQQIARDQMKKAALESLKTITATFNHYINNATATILGRAQLLELAVDKGHIKDDKGQLQNSLDIMIKCVNTISLVMKELKNLTNFETTVYHEENYIIDIENKIKKQMHSIDQLSNP